MTNLLPGPHRRLPSLDGLRGVAALVVLIHHLLLFLPSFVLLQQRAAAPSGFAQLLLAETPLHLLWAGDEAVIVFFVLSGFALAAPVFAPSRFRWGAYFPSRLVRLYLPVAGAVALSAAVLLTAPAAVAQAAQAFAPRPGGVTLRSVLLDSTLLDAPTALNNPLWSLHYEIAFSMLLPLYILTVRRNRHPWLLLAAAVGTSTVGLLIHVPLAQFLPIFAIGVLLARNRQAVEAWVDAALDRRRELGVLAALGAAAALPVMWYPLPSAVRDVLGWPVLLLAAGTLVVLAAHWAPLVAALSRPAARRLGVLSFSLYLTHMPVLLGLRALLGADRTAVLLVVGAPAAFAVAVLFHRFVEAPSHRLARSTARATEVLLRRRMARETTLRADGRRTHVA